jgi:hypothetical protein
MSDENLEQRIHIKFCAQIGNSASETLAILAWAYGEYAMKKSSVSEWHRRFKDEKMCNMALEVGSQNRKDRCKCGQSKNLRRETNSGRIEYGNLL